MIWPREADEADLGALQCRVDLGEVLAIVDAVFDLLWIIVAEGPGDEAVPQRADADAVAFAVERRQVRLHDVAARIEEAAVDNQVAVLVDDAGAHRGVGEQALQHGAGSFRVDGKVEARHLVGVGQHLLAAVSKRVGVDHDGAGVDGCRARHGGGDDLCLRRQALYARVDEALAELVEVENARHEHDEAEQVEQHDAAGQPVRPDASHQARPGRSLAFRGVGLIGVGAVGGLGRHHLVKHRRSPGPRVRSIAP